MRRIRDHAPAAIACASVGLFGVFAAIRGHVPDWDFRNYHWYNAFAWLSGRRGFDVAVAHHPRPRIFNMFSDLSS